MRAITSWEDGRKAPDSQSRKTSHHELIDSLSRKALHHELGPRPLELGQGWEAGFLDSAKPLCVVQDRDESNWAG